MDVFITVLRVSAQGFAQRSSAVYREKQWSGLHGSAPVGRYGAIRVSLLELEQVNKLTVLFLVINRCILLSDVSFSSPQTVGVIIRLDRDMFSVLNQHGKVSIHQLIRLNLNR